MGLGKLLADIFFPPRCMLCRKIIDEGHICPDCRGRLPMCGRVDVQGEFYSECCAPLYYTGDVRGAMLRYKFRGHRGYCVPLSQMMARCVRDNLMGRFDLVTWVPVSAGRLRRRGYDQSRLLAERVAEQFDMKAVRTLRKRRHTRANSSLKGREARAANILGAYEAVDSPALRGARVLLIDDIVTTGATMSECARILLMAGAEDVVCAAAASAGKEKIRKY